MSRARRREIDKASPEGGSARKAPVRPAEAAGGNTAPGDPVRERILAAFSAWARRSGIRSVVMGELATRLRMSAMTLYKHFASKDEIVNTMVDRWADELAAINALEWDKVKDGKSALETLLRWSDAWTASMSAVSPVFFEDLRRDYPDAWARFQGLIIKRQLDSAPYFIPLLRKDINPMVSLRLLNRLVMLAADPAFGERFGISRQEAVRTALSIWGGGALKERTILESPSPRTPAAPDSDLVMESRNWPGEDG
ncbi:MAG: TetR/AcrR family transcriptional regulator [Deltaproteobacteria bacterium]|nr:TetR/AcrR family transcriptional regulator [Deltaproteobacteria bacterium]